jgi:transcriptional regulator with XRE-family HTH domain
MTLSVKCDTSSNYIGQIEMGRRIPSFDKIEKIAQALEIPVQELFLYETEKQMDIKSKTKDYLGKMPVNVKKEIISRLTVEFKENINASFNPRNY